MNENFSVNFLLISPSVGINQDFLHQYKHRFIFSGGDGFTALSGSCQVASWFVFFFWVSHFVELSLWPSLNPPELELQLLHPGGRDAKCLAGLEPQECKTA